MESWSPSVRPDNPGKPYRALASSLNCASLARLRGPITPGAIAISHEYVAPSNVARVFNTIRDMTDDELLDAWREVHDATPSTWFVGRPTYNERRDVWSLYAFDTTERLNIGRRSRGWTAIAPTQARVLREMARCLRDLAADRPPR